MFLKNVKFFEANNVTVKGAADNSPEIINVTDVKTDSLRFE